MSDLQPCPICGKQLKVHGPEDWKPSFYDPDSGGGPYCFVCDCGFHFDTDTYNYQEAVERANGRVAVSDVMHVREMNNDELVELFREIYCAGQDDESAYQYGIKQNSFIWDVDWLQKPWKEESK